MDSNKFSSLLESVIQHWDQSAKAYAAYMENGKRFRYAETLMVHNTAVKNLLTNNSNIVPGDYKTDVEAIIEHYTIWSAKWEELKTKLNPGAEDEFAFENDHRFPKAASQRLEAALRIEDAAHYDQFYGPLFFEPYAIEVAKRIDPARVSIALEIGSGTGRVTRHIRERIPAAAKLIASDISEDMLSIAKKKLSHLEIEWRSIDAQQLPFDANSFDLVVCCFGYMFVPDKPKSFAEAWRVLKPGGMLLFTTWDKLDQNGASYLSRSIGEEYFEGPIPESYNLPTSMNDEGVIRQLLQDAGFSKISVEKVKQFSVSASAKEAANGFVKGGTIFKEIKKRNSSLIEEIKTRVEKRFAEEFGEAPMVAPISAVVSQGWK